MPESNSKILEARGVGLYMKLPAQLMSQHSSVIKSSVNQGVLFVCL
jgi:hypothetical protein